MLRNVLTTFNFVIAVFAIDISRLAEELCQLARACMYAPV